MYVLRYVNTRGAGRFIPLVVRSSEPGEIAVVLSFNTYQAYNSWGGASFYNGFDGLPQAPRVSFLRPYSDWTLRLHFLATDLRLVRFLERWGYPATYLSDRDFEADPLAGFVIVFYGLREGWAAWHH